MHVFFTLMISVSWLHLDAMQKLLNICEEYCKEFYVSFNVNKSKILFFGNSRDCHIADLVLDERTIEVVNEWKYLGVTVIAGTTLSLCVFIDP